LERPLVREWNNERRSGLARTCTFVVEGRFWGEKGKPVMASAHVEDCKDRLAARALE